MNDFIEQFLIESRELVDQATDDLLTLEGNPDDPERLDSAFRAFHTLKGAAGIVDFDAMGRALHAAEDVLSSLRAGSEPITPQLISDCLTCLDQVVRWLDAMQDGGELPTGAEAAADTVVKRFQRTAPMADQPAARSTAWHDELVAAHPGVQASVAIRYAPDANAFLRGEDPLALLATAPNLLVMEVEQPSDWPPLEDMDPFSCRLTFRALSGGPISATQAVFQPVASQVELVEIGETNSLGRPPLSSAAEALIEGQLLLLARTETEGRVGRMASAGRVVSNILRHVGRDADAMGLERELAVAMAAGDVERLSRAIVLAVKASPAQNADVFTAEVVERAPAEMAARTLRIDVDRIDALVSLTGELLVAKNALGHVAAQAQAGVDAGALATQLKDQHAVLQRLVDELQRSVLNIRVLQMRTVFQRFPRLVREMVVTLGKPAHLVTEGDDTEADKVIVEGLFEPLLHVLRNALDHGVEQAAARTAAGKPASATITLRARRQNENVIVEVQDDGGGVNVARVRAVAAQRGVYSVDALAAMTDAEIVDLIFASGFSTASEVSNISGRGVGMDAVRSAIERLGGRVMIDSRAGEGTTVRFTLPFAVMMSRVLTVEAGGQLFGIPLEAVQETVRIARSEIKPIGGGKAFVLRNRTAPLVDLSEVLGDQRQSPRTAEANLVIASAAGHLAGLEVDRLGERLDVMLKPMDGLLAGVPGIAGTTLLGDGQVLLVLDLQELLR